MMSYGFIFPGQGSQSVGMLQDLAANFPLVKNLYAEASEVLGYDLWQIVQEGPEPELNQTHITQPALLTAGYAVYQVMASETPVQPVYMAGHSLGEYTALVAAESLSFAQGVQLVAERGRLMQNAVEAGKGAMAAVIGLEDEKIAEICQQVEGVVEPANFNSPGQVVIAGYQEAVAKAIDLLQAAGAKKVVKLAVSVPSHCSLMKPAAEHLAEFMASLTFQAPKTPVLHNADVQSHTEDAAIKQALIKQLYCPVQWVKTVQFMASEGVSTLYELGPGKVLMGLNRRIDRKVKTLPVYDTTSVQKAVTALNPT